VSFRSVAESLVLLRWPVTRNVGSDVGSQTSWPDVLPIRRELLLFPNRVLLSKTSASPVKQIDCVGLADQLLSNPAGNSRRAAELLYCSPKRRARHQLGELTEGRLAVSASFREVC